MVQAAYAQTNQTNPYLVQKVMTASPEQLVLYVFDAASLACKRKDKDKAMQALQVLIGSLKFDYHEIATNFYNTYHGIINVINQDKYDLATTMIADIKGTWQEAMNVK
ncbi:MAG: hypothetical protein KAI81_02880 [Candidatus Marinimicrobia bacterium]|nr:hypothetical protein [Candidatus Neomarinimicrobiota bacterium]